MVIELMVRSLKEKTCSTGADTTFFLRHGVYIYKDKHIS